MKTFSRIGIGSSEASASRDPQATMNFDSRGATMYLKRRQHVQFHGLRGWTLHAVGGALWITQDGDRHDTIIEPGETFRIERDERVVIGALADGGLTLAPETSSRRINIDTAKTLKTSKRLSAPWFQVTALFT